MSLILRGLVVLAGLIVSANAKLHAVILGQPVSVPALWLVAAAVLLILVAFILYLIRRILAERPQPAPRPVYVVTSLH